MSIIESRFGTSDDTDLTPVREPSTAGAELYGRAVNREEPQISAPSGEPDLAIVDAWVVFANSLAGFRVYGGPGSGRWLEPAESARAFFKSYRWSSPSAASGTADRRRRYASLCRLLEEWANDPSDFDAEVDSLAEQALRETAPRHFRE